MTSADDLTEARDAVVAKFDRLIQIARALEAGIDQNSEGSIRATFNATAGVIEEFCVALIDRVGCGAPVSIAPVDLDDVKSAFVLRCRENAERLPDLTSQDRSAYRVAVL